MRARKQRGAGAEGRGRCDALVGLAGAREERPQRVQLRHDAAAREEVDGRVVRRGLQAGRGGEDVRLSQWVGPLPPQTHPEENLWRAVPARRDVVREGRPRTDLAREAEVGELDGLALDEAVLRPGATDDRGEGRDVE